MTVESQRCVNWLKAIPVILLLPLFAVAQRGAHLQISSARPNGTTRALIIGITHYTNIVKAEYAADDAVAFRDYLLGNPGSAVRSENISLLIDTQATRGHIFRELKKLADLSKRGDLAYIYFAGHGDVEADIDAGFLLAHNCEKTNYPATDAVGVEYLEKYVDAMTRNGVQVRVIMDACRSGKLAGGLTGIENTMTALTLRFKNTVKLLSCQPGEVSVSHYYPQGGHGVFTWHLINGLKGLADADNDEVVTIDELETYVKKHVTEETGRTQHPKIEGLPETHLAFTDSETKASLLAGHVESVGVAAAKELGLEFADSLNTVSKQLYVKFREDIQAGRLMKPENDNACKKYKYAKDTLKDHRLAAYMQEELIAELQDDAQKVINSYLKGQVIGGSRSKKTETYRMAASAEQFAASLIDKNSDNYRVCTAKSIFLNEYETIIFGIKTPTQEHIALIHEADRLMPGCAYLKELLGMCYRRSDTTKAILYFNEAISLARTWPTPYNSLGKMYMYLGQYDKAHWYFQQAIARDSDYVNVYYNIAWSYALRNRVDESLAAFEKALQKGYDDWETMKDDNNLKAITSDKRYHTLIGKYRNPQKQMIEATK